MQWENDQLICSDSIGKVPTRWDFNELITLRRESLIRQLKVQTFEWLTNTSLWFLHIEREMYTTLTCRIADTLQIRDLEDQLPKNNNRLRLNSRPRGKIC